MTWRVSLAVGSKIPMKTIFVSLVGLMAFASCSRSPDPPVPDAASLRPGVAAPKPAESEARPVPVKLRPLVTIDRVLIISVDGLRPDLLLRAETPWLHRLLKSGSYTFWGETAPEAYTLPCHVSMLTGVPSEKHGVTWNNYIEESYPNVPTLFEVAKRAGLSTALAAGKMKFIVFLRPNTVDHHYIPRDEPVTDRAVATQAVHLLREYRPRVLFVHLPGVDTTGHQSGWGSPEQITAIERADEAVGLVLGALAGLKLTDSTLVIVTADHGGAGKDHKAGDPRSRHIPWIASGPGVRRDFDLTSRSERTIKIEDTFATACAFLGINPGEECVGRPILEMLENSKP
jgi:Type I phosphodiesterase / nucleotide pyrophosphatase